MLTYEPIDTVEPADCTAKPSKKRVECPTCSKSFSAGAIVTHWEEMGWHEGEGCWIVRRTVFCDHCHHLIDWLESLDGFNAACICSTRRCTCGAAEQVTGTGSLSGVIISGPGIRTGKREVARFLKKHPQAAGVAV